MFATWKLRLNEYGYFDGPESLIVERGGSAHAIWLDGIAEDGGLILGKVDGDVEDLGSWQFTVLSISEAEAFITNSFVPIVNRITGVETTLENALTVLL